MKVEMMDPRSWINNLNGWKRTKSACVHFKENNTDDRILIFVVRITYRQRVPYEVVSDVYEIFFCLEGVYMTPGWLSRRSEFTPVPSHGPTSVYMIPPQNVMPARVTPAWVHLGCCAGARISLRYEISRRYHINAKRPHVSVWNRSAGCLPVKLERVAHV